MHALSTVDCVASSSVRAIVQGEVTLGVQTRITVKWPTAILQMLMSLLRRGLVHNFDDLLRCAVHIRSIVVSIFAILWHMYDECLMPRRNTWHTGHHFVPLFLLTDSLLHLVLGLLVY